MSKSPWLMLFIGNLVFSLCTQTSGQKVERGFHPQRQASIVAYSKDFTVRLKKKGAQLSVLFERGQETVASVSLPQEMAQVDSIDFAVGQKVAVIGHVNGSVRQVVLIDTITRTIIDKFYCYEPNFSPDKRFLAFVKFFPPHFVEGVSYQYLLYDFAKSPADNRPPNISVGDPQNVGAVLYPTNVTNQIGDNTGQPPSRVHLMASGSFFWSPSGKRVAFADSHSGIVRLVVVELRGATPILQVVERELRKVDICKSRQDLDSCTFVVSNIEFIDTGVTLAIRAHSGEVKLEIQLQL